MRSQHDWTLEVYPFFSSTYCHLVFGERVALERDFCLHWAVVITTHYT